MTVYQSTHPSAGDFKKVSQIKIKNSRLEECGFTPGREYEITYEKGQITLTLKQPITNLKGDSNV